VGFGVVDSIEVELQLVGPLDEPVEDHAKVLPTRMVNRYVDEGPPTQPLGSAVQGKEAPLFCPSE